MVLYEKHSMKKKHYPFLYRNSLSIAVLFLMLFSLSGQFLTGWHRKNGERLEKNLEPISMSQYAVSGHFMQATFENWESEFLQMAIYVILTVYLRQKGSSESKKLDEKSEVDREPVPYPNAPWPVRKGGVWLKLYSHSLSLVFALLFLLSFILHLLGSLKDYNEDQIAQHLPTETWANYIAGSRFWFESFQNWQSEFLSIASIVILSIWLREKGSPESKPVDAPYDQTGD
jgi:hypothetical protein